MKKLIFITLFMVLVSSIKGQTMRHVKGNVGVEFSGHLTAFDPAFSIGYTNFFKDDIIGKVKFNYEAGNIGLSDYRAMFLMPSIQHTPFNIKSVVFFNIEGGLVIGVEKSSNPEFILEENTFLYGFNMGQETEFFIGGKIAILLNINQLLTFNSKFGNARYQIGTGVRYFIK